MRLVIKGCNQTFQNLSRDHINLLTSLEPLPSIFELVNANSCSTSALNIL